MVVNCGSFFPVINRCVREARQIFTANDGSILQWHGRFLPKNGSFLPANKVGRMYLRKFELWWEENFPPPNILFLKDKKRSSSGSYFGHISRKRSRCINEALRFNDI